MLKAVTVLQALQGRARENLKKRRLSIKRTAGKATVCPNFIDLLGPHFTRRIPPFPSSIGTCASFATMCMPTSLSKIRSPITCAKTTCKFCLSPQFFGPARTSRGPGTDALDIKHTKLHLHGAKVTKDDVRILEDGVCDPTHEARRTLTC